MKTKAHIIYSPEDEPVAAAIRRSLEGLGVRCSGIGPSDLPAQGKPAVEALEGSDLAILIMSAAAVNDSTRVKREVEQAAKADKTIIPFRIDTAPLPKYLEFYLSTAHWLDASTPPLDNHLAQLVTAARRLLGLEAEYVTSSVFWRGRRPAKKAVAAAVFGVLSLIVLSVILGPVGVILGGMELRTIASGRSSVAGRKYALVGVVSGSLGTVLGIVMLFLIWYYDLDLAEGWRELFGSSSPGPEGPR